MRFVFFFQTSNLHLIKQKYKSFLIIFIIKRIRKTSLKTKKIEKKMHKNRKKMKIDKVRIEKIKT